MYEDILPQQYKDSFANPACAVRELGETFGPLLSFLYAQERGLIAYVFEEKEEELTIHVELFVQICALLRQSRKESAADDRDGFSDMEDPKETARSVRDALYWFESDYADVIVAHRIREGIDPDCSFFTDILMNADFCFYLAISLWIRGLRIMVLM